MSTDRMPTGSRYVSGEYVRTTEDMVPSGVRFDVPASLQGQTVEIAYGTFGRGEGGPGDPFMRVHDYSDRSTAYYRYVAEERS